MASEAIIAELLRQAEAERNRPSQFAQGMAQGQQIMQGLLQGLQLYDAVKGIKYKWNGPTPSTPAQPPIAQQTPTAAPPVMAGMTPSAPVSMSAAGTPAGGTAGMTSLTGMPPIITQAAQAMAQSMSAPQPTAPAVSPGGMNRLPTGQELEYIKGLEQFPSAARAAAEKLGIGSLGPSIKETQAGQTKNVYLTDEAGNILGTMQVNKRDEVKPQSPQSGNILVVNPDTGKTSVAGQKKKGDVIVRNDTNTGTKTPEEKLQGELNTIEDNARTMAKDRASDMGFFDAKKYDQFFQEEYTKRVSQLKLPKAKQDEILANMFTKPSMEEQTFRTENPGFIEQAKQRVRQMRVAGNYNVTEAKQSLVRRGVPEKIILEILNAQ